MFLKTRWNIFLFACLIPHRISSWRTRWPWVRTSWSWWGSAPPPSGARGSTGCPGLQLCKIKRNVHVFFLKKHNFFVPGTTAATRTMARMAAFIFGSCCTVVGLRAEEAEVESSCCNSKRKANGESSTLLGGGMGGGVGHSHARSNTGYCSAVHVICVVALQQTIPPPPASPPPPEIRLTGLDRDRLDELLLSCMPYYDEGFGKKMAKTILPPPRLEARMKSLLGVCRKKIFDNFPMFELWFLEAFPPSWVNDNAGADT